MRHPRKGPRHSRSISLSIGVIALAACTADDRDRDESIVAQHATVGQDHGQSVTLITGDRVTLRDGAPFVTPGPGRRHIRFEISRIADRIQVIPSDARAALAAGQLDPLLFDVTGLIAEGRGKGELPLLISGVGAPSLAALPGLVIDRAMPALHVVAAHRAPGVASLTSALPAGAKIWLDRKLKPSLDRSVPQIGGDVAHARGFTGAGITVAVLDTGVDTNHPDLAGKVALAEEFVGDGRGPLDLVGHGTHVASIIAGTGAASGGQFAGVAPAAQLISGRVCDEFGCDQSAMLAGMEWATVEHGAKIVNISIGGRDTPGVDLLEDGVNTLSAETGALFVISAGNRGQLGDRTVENPASADAALAVGAVDRDDALAVFSSRGPRVGDDAIKPEIIAPGVGIVAAMASGIDPIGTPVGTQYQALSGTSMAAPHVAGAAALLLQQHPDWTGAQLKAQLIASAKPNPALTIFAQGGGRVDLDRGTRQAVTADPAVLSLGTTSFPHDDDPPTVRTVRYHNAGAAPVTLGFTAALQGPSGPGVIAVTPASLTIAAGATGDATVTVRTDLGGADGLYAGTVVATGGDVRVETPVEIRRDVQTFPVTFELRDHGAPAAGDLTVRSVTGSQTVAVDGSATIRLPGGTVALEVVFFADGFPIVWYPRFDPAVTSTATFDSAAAGPLAVDVGDPGAIVATTGFHYLDHATGIEVGEFAFDDVPFATGQAGPPVGDHDLVTWIDRSFSDQPFGTAQRSYFVAHAERGRVLAGWQEIIDRRRLAQVEVHVAGSPDATFLKGSFGMLDEGARGLQGFGILPLDTHVGPYDTTEYYYGDGFVWDEQLQEGRIDADGNASLVAITFADKRYAAGRLVKELWGGPPAAPEFPAILQALDDRVLLLPGAERLGDHLFLAPTMFGDGGGRNVFRTALHERVAVRSGGVTLAEEIDPFLPLELDVPAGAATYRYEHDVEVDPAVFSLSTKIHAAWTFRSAHASGDAPHGLPLLTMRFEPAVDDQGRTGARVLVMPIRFARADAVTPFVLQTRLEVSFDDGAHWQQVPVAAAGDRAVAVIVHPRDAAFVSLRATATDIAGHRVEEEITRAYTFKR